MTQRAAFLPAVPLHRGVATTAGLALVAVRRSAVQACLTRPHNIRNRFASSKASGLQANQRKGNRTRRPGLPPVICEVNAAEPGNVGLQGTAAIGFANACPQHMALQRFHIDDNDILILYSNEMPAAFSMFDRKGWL